MAEPHPRSLRTYRECSTDATASERPQVAGSSPARSTNPISELTGQRPGCSKLGDQPGDQRRADASQPQLQPVAVDGSRRPAGFSRAGLPPLAPEEDGAAAPFPTLSLKPRDASGLGRLTEPGFQVLASPTALRFTVGGRSGPSRPLNERQDCQGRREGRTLAQLQGSSPTR